MDIEKIEQGKNQHGHCPDFIQFWRYQLKILSLYLPKHVHSVSGHGLCIIVSSCTSSYLCTFYCWCWFHQDLLSYLLKFCRICVQVVL
jgi:hypothetical protein